MICKYVLPFCGLSFHVVYGFLCCAKTFKFNEVPSAYFCFFFHNCRRWVQRNIAAIYVKGCSMFFFWEFYSSKCDISFMICFDLNFVYDVNYKFKVFWMYTIILAPFFLCQRSVMWVYFWALYSDFFFFLVFLGMHLQYMEVPRLGVQLEL